MVTVMKPRDVPGEATDNKRLSRERTKKMVNDLKMSYNMISEARFANAHIDYKEKPASITAYGNMEPLANWHKTNRLAAEAVPGL